MSASLWPHGLKHARLTYRFLVPRVCSNSCPLNQWCHPIILFSVAPFSSCLHLSSLRVFSNEFPLCIRWPKYWSFSFSISPSLLFLCRFNVHISAQLRTDFLLRLRNISSTLYSVILFHRTCILDLLNSLISSHKFLCWFLINSYAFIYLVCEKRQFCPLHFSLHLKWPFLALFP